MKLFERMRHTLFDFGQQSFATTTSGYDAIKGEKRRKSPNGILRSEDAEANDFQRRQLLSGARDSHRNITILAWMIRKHVDYVSTFTFKADTGNKALDKRVEERVAWWSKPENFDVAARHGRQRAMRLAEVRRVVDGDMLVTRLKDGRTQWIEGDRVRVGFDPPDNIDPHKIIHGVQINDAGRALAYAISRRGSLNQTNASSFIFERMVSARNAYLHAYFDRFDQTRGISPLTTALNELRDTYESFDYARAKMKVSQIFALAIYREYYEDEQPADRNTDGGYEVDYGKGPITLDMDPGDKAEFLESKTPSTEFQSFSQTVIAIALKALDIPYSFFSEDFTNYSGSRGALLQYDRSAETKRDDNRNLLDWLTNWRMLLFSLDGEFPGADPAALRGTWIATGVPWIDPLKEVLSNIQAVGAAMDTRTRILAAQGLVFDDVVDTLAHEAKRLRDAGLPLNLDMNNALIHALTTDAPNKAAA